LPRLEHGALVHELEEVEALLLEVVPLEEIDEDDSLGQEDVEAGVPDSDDPVVCLPNAEG